MLNRALLILVLATLPSLQVAASQKLTVSNGIYDARLEIMPTPNAESRSFRVVGTLQNNSTTKLQFLAIEFSYGCPDGSRRDARVWLGSHMPEVESDRKRWLPAGAGMSIDLSVGASDCGWDHEAWRGHSPNNPSFTHAGLPFAMPGLDEARIACGDRDVGIVLDLGGDGRVFRVETTENIRVTVGPDSLLADDADARIRKLVCGSDAAVASAGSIHAGILIFMRRWAEFCETGNDKCQEAFQNAFRRAAGSSRG